MSESRIKSVKVGDTIEDKIYDEDGWRVAQFKVTQIHQNFVLAKEKKRGMRRCFCYGDLIMKGLETQSAELQVLAHSRSLHLQERRPTPRKGI